jgi:hypothetical protein
MDGTMFSVFFKPLCLLLGTQYLLIRQLAQILIHIYFNRGHLIEKLVRNKFAMYMFYFSNFQLLQEEHRIIFTAVPLIFRTVIATTETLCHGTNFSIPWR